MHIDLSVELDAGNIARDGEEEDEDVEDAENADNNDSEEGDFGSTEMQRNKIIVAMAQRPLKVCLAAANELCFKDLSFEGRKIMEKQNPEIARHNCQERALRKMNFYATVHTNLECMNDGEDIFESAFDRLINN